MNFRYIISINILYRIHFRFWQVFWTNMDTVRHPWRTSRTCAASGAGSRANRASWKRGMAKHGSSVAKQWVSRKTNRKPMGWWWPTKLLWIGSIVSHCLRMCERPQNWRQWVPEIHLRRSLDESRVRFEGRLNFRLWFFRSFQFHSHGHAQMPDLTWFDRFLWFVDDFSSIMILMSRHCWQVGKAQQSAPAILWSQKTIQQSWMNMDDPMAHLQNLSRAGHEETPF